MFWTASINLAEDSDWHSHDVIELVFCRDGAGSLLLEQQSVELLGNRSILLSSKVVHRYSFREEESADLKFILRNITGRSNLSLASSVVRTQVHSRT